MKKKALIVILSLVLVMAAGAVLYGCATDTGSGAQGSGSADTGSQGSSSATNGPSGSINVVSREDGSGTRSAFVELFEVQVENAEGKKVDATTTAAVVTNSTSVMMTTVSGDKNAIGYISLGSLNDTVKALQIDGVEATTDNVKSGSYKISRPFNIVTKGATSSTFNPAAQDFINFILSAEGQAVIAENHYIAVNDSAPAYSKDPAASGKIVVAGSSSVSPVMEKLKEAYATANPAVSVEIQTSDSSTGISSTIDGICDIGMASRELKDTEAAAGLAPTTIAIDGIAVIVSNSNSISGLSKEQVASIFLGNATKWEDISK